MSYSLCFPLASARPLIGGEFRERLEDFEVDEVLGFEPCGSGEHVWLNIRKQGANTAWVAEQLARYLDLRDFDVSYAGRKDRHAVATQWFSCWLPGREAPAWSALSIAGVEILSARRHERKLRRGNHAGNRFRIRIRDISIEGDRQAAVADLHARVERIAAGGFPNYFGEQRFGQGGRNLHRADELMKGKRMSRRRRDLYISAARSYLFNRTLASRVRDGSWREPNAAGWLPGIFRVPDETIVREREFHTWYEGLEALGVKAMQRPLAVVPQDLSVVEAGDDLIFAFELPAGSYATSLLREVVRYNTRHHLNDDEDAAFGQAT